MDVVPTPTVFMSVQRDLHKRIDNNKIYFNVLSCSEGESYIQTIGFVELKEFKWWMRAVPSAAPAAD